jgi:hypothetical protein
MKLRLIFFVLLIAVHISDAASAQIKSWTDDKGVTHFESRGLPPEPSPRGKELGEPNISRRIERSHGGFTLGDHESSIRSRGQGIYRSEDKLGAKVYDLTDRGLPPGAQSGTAMFVADRLAAIIIEYDEAQFGSWGGLIKQTTEKYGTALVDEVDRKSWTDRETGLTFERTDTGTVTATVTDSRVMETYKQTVGAAAPKF